MKIYLISLALNTIAILIFLSAGSAYSELKSLDDDTLAKVDAAAGPLIVKTAAEIEETDKTKTFFNKDLEHLKMVNDCSGQQMCEDLSAGRFLKNYPDPFGNIVPMSGCRSGGCR